MIKKPYVRKLKMKDGMTLPFLFVQNKEDLIIFLALGERQKRQDTNGIVIPELSEVCIDNFVNIRHFDPDDYWYFRQDLSTTHTGVAFHYFALLKSKDGKPDLVKYKYEPMYHWVRDWDNDEDETGGDKFYNYDPDKELKDTYQWQAFSKLLTEEMNETIKRHMAQKLKEWSNDQK